MSGLSASGIAGIVQGGIGITTAIAGGISAGVQRRKINKYYDRLNQENEDWYNLNGKGDYVDNVQSQAMIRNLRNNLNRNNEITANSAVVTGASPELIAAQKAASTKTMGDVYSNISVMGQRWKDNIQDKYLARKSAIDNGKIGILNDKAKSYENLMYNGLSNLTNSFNTFNGGSSNYDSSQGGGMGGMIQGIGNMSESGSGGSGGADISSGSGGSGG
jgi:hypothetical protein